MDTHPSKQRSPSAKLLTRTEAIDAFLEMATDARQRGREAFADAWIRAAERLKAQTQTPAGDRVEAP